MIKPAVGMIHLPGDPISETYKNLVVNSWINDGFKVYFYPGTTPTDLETINEPLNFGLKSQGRNKGKPLTDTEKAIWYSHRTMWEMASKKANPLIVIEHDALLLQHLDFSSIERYPIVGICHCGLLSKHSERGYRVSAGGAYILTSRLARKMISNIPEEITINSDAYLHNYITRYGVFNHHYATQLYLPDVGSTIQHD
jgi:hypothetical protein